MKLTEKEFKLKKKLQRLIDFSIEQNRSNYLKRDNHAPGRKLKVSTSYYNGDITIFFGEVLFALDNDSLGNIVYLENTLFVIRDYDDDELFNLSTIHSNETITLLKLYSTLDLHEKRLVLKKIDYQLICDACNSIDTQYEKFNRDNYTYGY